MRTILLLFTLCYFGCGLSAQAETVPQLNKALDLQRFKSIIVLENGRIKPLDTFAKNLLLRFSGRSNLYATSGKRAAVTWLAESLFNPQKILDEKIFLIDNPELLEALGVEVQYGRRYSFNALKDKMGILGEFADKAYNIEETKRTLLDKEFLRLFFNLHTYVQITNSFSIFRASEDFTVVNKDQSFSQYSFYQVMQNAPNLESIISGIHSKPQSLEENNAVKLGVGLYSWIEKYRIYMKALGQKQLLYLIPIFDQNEARLEWYTVWDSLIKNDPSSRIYLEQLNKIYQAYNAINQKAFDKAIKEFNNTVKEDLKTYGQKIPNLNLEIFYNRLMPFFKAKVLYGISLFVLLISVLFASLSGKNYPIFSKVAFISLLLGFILHSIGLVDRVLILSRPPVSNLFETFIFISWVSVSLGLLLELLSRFTGLFAAAFSGLVLLLVSGKFASEADTLQVLIAVLDSNFWLSTHVICVSIGYAGTALAGLVGHIYMIKAVLRADQKELSNLNRTIMGVLGFGLCFSFLGTMLGGIWADQSWGRFWGWDPKENGALLIVLWTAIIFHARLAGLVKNTGIAVLSIIGTMVVMLSWFGINLLGVGLHSYGFTSGLAQGLAAYYVVEIVFILMTYYLIQRYNPKLSGKP